METDVGLWPSCSPVDGDGCLDALSVGTSPQMLWLGTDAQVPWLEIDGVQLVFSLGLLGLSMDKMR